MKQDIYIKPTSFDTPHYDAAMMDVINDMDMGKMGDWSNKERHERDPNLIIEYGVKNGIAFMQKTQIDLDDYLLLAKLKLQQFHASSSRERNKIMGLSQYGLLHIIIDEMEIQGIPVREIMKSGDHTEVNTYMVNNYPQLLWVPASYIKTNKNKIIIH